jgi:prolipoprotein diacylglyceryl transferase
MTAVIVLGTYVASRYIARQGRDPGSIWEMLLWVLIPAVVGARLYFVFIQSPRGPTGLGYYLAHPIAEVWRGGIHIYGAFILGGLAALLYLRVRKLPLLLYLDAVGLGLLPGQSIGRLGNFFNQELYGPPTKCPGACASTRPIASHPIIIWPCILKACAFSPSFSTRCSGMGSASRCCCGYPIVSCLYCARVISS